MELGILPKENTNRKSFLVNIFYAMLAQVISLLLSIIMALVVPRVLGLEEFSYWQLFLFYSGYSGFFHFGINDGIYLREGGRNYQDLNKQLVGTQFQLLFIFHCLISVGIIIASISYIEDVNRLFVWITAAVSLPIINAGLFLGYIFQAVNKTKLYSVSVIIDKVSFIIMVLLLLLNKETRFDWFVIAYICSKVISTAYCTYLAKDLTLVLMRNFSEVFKELKINFSVGINLMLANISGLLIIGNSRFILDKVWGITLFGTISFSLLISTFFLSFISQISMVLFPALRQVNELRLKVIYGDLRSILSIVLTAVPLMYLPIYYLVKFWLPQYFEGIIFLALLIPLVTYEGKMNLLCITYFKVLRKENLLLKINLSSLLLSLIIGLIGGFIVENVYVVIASMLIAISFKAIISELYLAKMLGQKITKNIILESLMVLIYLISVCFFDQLICFMFYFTVYVVFLYYNKSNISKVLTPVKKYYEKLRKQ